MCTAETTPSAIRNDAWRSSRSNPPLIGAVGDVGPDRRRFDSAEYKGLTKRGLDPRDGEPAAQLSQALRIGRSAARHFDTDPIQARRALARRVEI
jgi:hypothetical protein